MKKLRYLFLLAAIACMTPLGCGGGGSSTADQPEPVEAEVDPGALMGGEMGADPTTEADPGGAGGDAAAPG